MNLFLKDKETGKNYKTMLLITQEIGNPFTQIIDQTEISIH